MSLSRRARAGGRPRRFRTRTPTARDAFHRIDLESCDPSRRVRASTVRRCLLPSRPFACRDVARLVKGRATASRYFVRNQFALRRAELETKKTRLTDFCNCTTFTTRAPARTVRLLRWRETLSRPASRPLEPKPHRTTQVIAPVDVAPPASASSTTLPTSSDEGAGAGCSWWDPRSKDPSDGAPPRRCCRPHARRKNEPLTLPVATPRGRSHPPPPEPLPPPLRQKVWFSRPEAPFLDELPARRSLTRPPRTRARHRTAGFATRDRLPTLLRPSLHEEGLDLAASASSSLASARRHASLVDFCNRNDPQARLRIAETRFPLFAPVLSHVALEPESVRLAPCGAAKPSCHGSGAGLDLRLTPVDPQHPSRRLRASRAWPQPDWPGHLLSLARDLPGRSGRFARSSLPGVGSAFAGSTSPDTRLRFVSGRAASRTPPRRGVRSAAPEVPSFAKSPHWGGTPLHKLSPACGVRP